MFKNTFEYEKYLDIKNFNECKLLTKFPISDHYLRIETERHECKPDKSGKLIKAH